MARELSLSRELQRRAERYLPGGVNSPVRAFRAVGGDPPFLERAEGAYLWDADGNRYLDYFGSWGPMILGHAYPPVVEAIQRAAERSASFGASTAAEADLAELVVAAMPSIEKLRFVNSGTEATMSAIRVARAFTGRKYVIKFEGCYHGHSDGLLAKAGSGVATFGLPGSAGVPEEIAHWTIPLPFNDLAAVEEAFAKHPTIACVIVEPVAGNMGCVPPATGYLEGLRRITQETESLLIFDEVMTGFRLALGGAQEVFGIDPDLTCLGKIIGGGLPCAAFGGKARMMDLLAPLGPVYQAGTLSGNPLGDGGRHRYVALPGRSSGGSLWRPRDSTRPRLQRVIAAAARDAGVAMETNRVGSMVTWFFTAAPVTDFATAAASDTEAFGRFIGQCSIRAMVPSRRSSRRLFSVRRILMRTSTSTVKAARTAFASIRCTATRFKPEEDRRSLRFVHAQHLQASTVTTRRSLPAQASSSIPVAARVTERSVPICRWPPSCRRMLLALWRRWLRRTLSCTRAAEALESVASQSCAVTFHITGVKPSSLATRNTSGLRLRMAAGTIPPFSPVASSMLALQAVSSSRTLADPSQSNVGWLIVWLPKQMTGLKQVAGNLQDAGVQNYPSEKTSHARDGEPASPVIAVYRDRWAVIEG